MLWMSYFQRPQNMKQSSILEKSPNLLYPPHYSCDKTGKCFQRQMLSGKFPQWPCKAQGRVMPSSASLWVRGAELYWQRRKAQPTGQPPTEAASPRTHPSMKRCHTDHPEIAHCLKKIQWRMPVVQTTVSSSSIKLSNANLSAVAVLG